MGLYAGSDEGYADFAAHSLILDYAEDHVGVRVGGFVYDLGDLVHLA